MAWRRVLMTTAAACALAGGCGDRGDVNLGALDFGPYSTAVRAIPNQPSLSNGTVLEGIRMSDAVADTSQFGSPLSYLWQAAPVSDTAGIAPVVGEAGGQVLDRLGWVAGYHAQYADTARPAAGGTPNSGIALSIVLLRFPGDAAARTAARALETTNWADYSETLAAPLPQHPEIAARYSPGMGALRLDTPIGPFVLRLTLEAPSDGIAKRVGELDAVVTEEVSLLRSFIPTPVAEIPALPADPDGLLARMVSTDPEKQRRPSPAFAVYGPTGALRDQLPAIRRDRLYARWGVDRDAVSDGQHLYRLRDNQAATDMAAALIAQSSGVEHEVEGPAEVPGTRCFQAIAPAADMPGYVCRLIVDNYYTEVRAGTAANSRQMAAAQYALLATR